ncbi:hypothetical protein AB0M20_45520, partial [Actinoplanes sp. NPDC051633]|uniref:hypothetical protein n=1 Tax=Actinoplanes sp. NPDC051633 TaxID=3155670 RepID=UPI003439EB61
MDFWDLTKLMFRRWYVSAPIFLVAIAATVFVAMQVKPDYVATSYVQLLPPSITPKATDETKASARNPWLDLGLPSLTKAGMISVQDQRVVEALKNNGLSDDFTLTQDAQMPIVTFEVIGSTEDKATETSEFLIKRYADSVSTLQKEYGAPNEQMITAKRLDLGDNVKESTSKVKRALIAVAAVGLLLAVAFTVAVDALLRRRRRKQDDDSAIVSGPRPPRAAGAAPVSPALPPNVAPPVVRTGKEYKSRSAHTNGTNGTNGVGDRTAIVTPPSPGTPA